MRQAINLSTAEYAPLSTLEMSLVTIDGLVAIRSDMNLLPETQEKLKETEAPILEKKKYEKYKYLLGDFNEKRVYKENFIDNNRIGKAHVTHLILENKKQNYAELVAAYSSDRSIPFVIGMILLETMRKVEHGIHYYEVKNGYATIQEWVPQKVKCVPPVNYYKMYITNHQSVKGMNDGYLLKTLQSFCYNRNATAYVLKMSRPTLTARLQSIGYLLPNGSVRPNFETWYHWQAELENYKDQMGNGSDKESRVTPPVAKKGWQTNITYSDLQIKAAYRENGYSIKKTADALGLTTAVVRQRIRNFCAEDVVNSMDDGPDEFEEDEEIDLPRKFTASDPLMDLSELNNNDLEGKE